jgi:hypothetical protein
MKKIAIIFSACSMLALNIQAQGSDKDFTEELSFGLKAGLNSSNVYDSKGEDFRADSKLGLAAGVFFAIPLGKYMGIQPEILFSQKGFQASGTILGSPYKFTRTTNFIDIPVLFAADGWSIGPFTTIIGVLPWPIVFILTDLLYVFYGA